MVNGWVGKIRDTSYNFQIQELSDGEFFGCLNDQALFLRNSDSETDLLMMDFKGTSLQDILDKILAEAKKTHTITLENLTWSKI